ncbi:MAG: S8 family serine peptidase [Planctomycetota bacterium]
MRAPMTLRRSSRLSASRLINRSGVANRVLADRSPADRSLEERWFDALEQRIVLSVASEWLAELDLSSYSPEVAALIQAVTIDGGEDDIRTFGERVETPSDIAPSVVEAADLIGLTQWRNDPRLDHIDGSGFATVIIDTGIDLDHPGFGPDEDGDGVADRIVFSYDFSDGNDPDASDVDGHGSHVSYTVAGGPVSTDEIGFFGSGVAPGADVIHLKVFPDGFDVGARRVDIEEALQWVIANAETYNIASVNLSLGNRTNFDTAQEGYASDEFAALAALDVIVVSAAGNGYAGFNSQGVSYPAADANSLAVGAVYDSNIGPVSYGMGSVNAFSTSADQITPFSQRHENLTEIFAPGGGITAAGPQGGFITLHGTSMASPHIAGVAVLMQQFFYESTGRRMTLEEFRFALENGSQNIFDGDNENDDVVNTFAEYNRVDVIRLVDSLLIPPQPDLETTLPGAQLDTSSLADAFVFSAQDIAEGVEWDFVFGAEQFLFESAVGGAIEIDGLAAQPGQLIDPDATLRWIPDAYAFTETLPALTVRGFDGRLAAVDATTVSIYLNEPPSVSSVDLLGVAIERRGFEIDVAELLERLQPADFEDDALDLRIVGLSDGVIRRAQTGVPIDATSSVSLLDAETLIWTPGVLAANETPFMRVAAFDGFNYSEPVELRAYVEVSPRFTYFNPLDIAAAPSAQTVTYEDLLGLTDLNDPNGDAFSLVISSVFNGALIREGLALDLASTGPTALLAGDSLIWQPDGTAQGAYAAFSLVASDGVLDSDPFVFRVRFAESLVIAIPEDDEPPVQDPQPPTEQDEPVLTPPPVYGSIDDEGGLFVFGKSTQGELLVFDRPAGELAAWRGTDLSDALGLGDRVGDPVTWFDELTGRTFAAAAVDGQLYLIRETDGGAWTAIDLTAQLDGALALATGLTAFTDIHGNTHLAGVADNGDLVLYHQTGSVDAFGNAEWVFRNLSEQDLRARGAESPQFTGDLIAYVTRWNGLHIAGLDENGDIQAVWWAPRLVNWQTDNLSAITGAKPLSGGLTAFITPWGAVNLAGADANGDLSVTWWVPSFGGDWQLTNLTEETGGPQLSAATTASFVTTWGGLNIAGIDRAGDLVVYWWSPGLNEWRADALTDLTESDQPVGTVRGIEGDRATMHLFSRAADGDVLRFYWSPTEGWNSENITEVAFAGA